MEQTRNYKQERKKNENTVTCFIFWKNLYNAGFVNLSTTDLLSQIIFLLGEAVLGIAQFLAASTQHPLSCENQNCLQALPNVALW